VTEPTWITTRSQLIDALAHLEAEVPLTGPAAGKVNAESMADAMLSQLPGGEDSVTLSREDLADLIGFARHVGQKTRWQEALIERVAAAAGMAADGALEAAGSPRHGQLRRDMPGSAEDATDAVSAAHPCPECGSLLAYSHTNSCARAGLR
jgi:hypothetical protein